MKTVCQVNKATLSEVAAGLIKELDSDAAATWGGVFFRYDTPRDEIAIDLQAAGLVHTFEIYPNGQRIRWHRARC